MRVATYKIYNVQVHIHSCLSSTHNIPTQRRQSAPTIPTSQYHPQSPPAHTPYIPPLILTWTVPCFHSHGHSENVGEGGREQRTSRTTTTGKLRSRQRRERRREGGREKGGREERGREGRREEGSWCTVQCWRVQQRQVCTVRKDDDVKHTHRLIRGQPVCQLVKQTEVLFTDQVCNHNRIKLLPSLYLPYT